MKLTERYNVIDIDTHIIEPADLWTSRMSKQKWGDLIPQTRVSSSGVQRWYMGDLRLPAAGAVAHAGWKDFPPSYPPTLDDADPATWQAQARLKKMDQYGIHSAVLYPNLLGFQCESFMKSSDREFGIECVQAYNDFLVDFCSEDKERLIPVMYLPFWDLEASVREIERCAQTGHRGVIFGGDFSSVNLPHLGDKHWDPIMAAAQDNNLSINFHIGFAEQTTEESRAFQKAVKDDKAVFVKGSTLMFMGNAQNIADVILTGLCERFPKLKFVSVESGASWLPFFIESLDWQWKGAGCVKEYPNRLLPSEYFRRQVYGSFWFESTVLKRALELFPDNIMFETDFPHPTSLSPGPASPARPPADVIEDALGDLSEDIQRKVLHDNAAKLYGLKSHAEKCRPTAEAV
jgi:predicted TIM-barrel fold metal-dependent hydrolase